MIKPPPKLGPFSTDLSYLPPMKEIPKKFFEFMRDPWAKQVTRWFYDGADKEWINRITAKPGVDRSDALRALAVLLQSFDPAHEHKIAGAAYLMSEWFTDPVLEG